MIILKRNYFLLHNGNKYRCSIGKNGIKRFKKEGDWCTPAGKFTLGPIYFRKDRITRLKTKIKVFPITKNMYWEDNPLSINYNKLSFNNKKSSEKLFRKELQHPKITCIRGKGLMLSVELQNEELVKSVIEESLNYGLLLFYFIFTKSSFRITPPLTISNQEIINGCSIIKKILDK